MGEGDKGRISARKQPKQARSALLVEAILTAAVQVLAAEGAVRFTCARVAERAGVSVGSLYQYFPNKAAILFRLQTDEWRATSEMLRAILTDTALPPLARVRALVEAFVRSECEEARMRHALDDAAPLYRDAPEAAAPRVAGTAVMRDFMRAALPDAPDGVQAVAASLLGMVLGDAGKRISDMEDAAEAAAHTVALADMLCGYLGSLGVR